MHTRLPERGDLLASKGTPAPEPFRVVSAGPSYLLEHASRLGLRGRVLASIAISWLPLVAFSLAAYVVTGSVNPLMHEIAVHTRGLIAIPIFLLAERNFDHSAGSAARLIFSAGLVRQEDEDRVQSILKRITRLCNSLWPEGVMLALAAVGSILSWLGILGSPGVSHVTPRQGLSGVWFALVSLPLFQFLLWRTLFRWALWVQLLVSLSRLPLQLSPSHPDCSGGLSFLKTPSLEYCGLLLLAVGSVVCGDWATEMLFFGAKLRNFEPLLYVVIAISAVIAFAPLLIFAPQLYVARREGLSLFRSMMTEYSRSFENCWLAEQSDPKARHDSQAQTLADLSASYRDNLQSMRLVPFSPKDVLRLLSVALLPVIPLLLLQLPLKEVFKLIYGIVTGSGLE